MMIRYSTLLLLAILSLFLTSCITIQETMHFNEDGSGDFSISIDMGEMIMAMDEFGAMGEMMAVLIPSCKCSIIKWILHCT